jgi:hypothetical protein
MGTNFYIRETSVNPQTGQRVSEDIHIGKWAGGWTFMFQGENFKTVDIWRNVISMMTPNMLIVDEYNTPFTPEEFWATVEQTTKPWGPKAIEPKTARAKTGNEWIDEGFHFYSGEFS